jgi:cation diffusion facilitator CzcD-associated flavoprotein CzcO
MVGEDIRLRSGVAESIAQPADHARESAYDVVVIGGGIGGLTAGALLSRAGRPALSALQRYPSCRYITTARTRR